jgi:D-alanyl-D-alanine carboxypeptidase/D-alanyl-D-alanine-endopeptidase (penicillin-binding protein 4)
MPESKTTRSLLFSLGTLACVLITILVSQAGFQSAGKSAPTESLTTPPTKAATTHELSKRPGDQTLAHEIDRVLDESGLAKARWGIFVMSLKDGRVLYSRDGDKLFTPASNMKIYTTAAALDLLGADYRWHTSVYANKQPDAGGAIEGDLTLYGRGSPDLISIGKNGAPSLADLADQLYQRGIRHVHGDVVGDESYFRGELYALGWQWNDLQWYFGAAPSALSIDANAFEISIEPGGKPGDSATVELRRESGYIHLKNNTATVERNAAITIGINRGLSDNEVRVWGEFPTDGRAFTAYLSVHDPALWAATLFKEALVARGIKVDGGPRSRDSRVAANEKFDPQQAFEVAGADSQTLGDVVRRTNKESNNLYAELILRTLGKERGAMAPDPDPHKNRERGDDEAGTAVIKSWLNRMGIGSEGLAIRDGSGLSRLDLVSPESTARVLAAIAGTSSGGSFHDSLPVAGRDGTLVSRLLQSRDRVFAKTGTLTYDHSLSGYAVTANGEVLAFSILCNDATTQGNPVRVIDQVASLLVAFDQPHSPK